MFFPKQEVSSANLFTEEPVVTPSNPTPAPDLFDLSKESERASHTSISSFYNLDKVYEDHNRKVKELTGQDLENPFYLTTEELNAEGKQKYYDDYDAYRRDGGGASQMSFTRQWAETEYRKKLEDLAVKYPDKRAELLPDQSFLSQSYQRRGDAAKAAQDAWDNSNQGALDYLAWYGGAMYGALHDPIQALALPFGVSGGGLGAKGIAIAAAKTGAINAATEAAIQPFVQTEQGRAGQEYGVGPAATAIGSAFLLGGALDAGIRVPFRAIAPKFGFQPVVKDGVVVAWKKPSDIPKVSAPDAPLATAPEIDTELMKRLEAGDIEASKEILAQIDGVAKKTGDVIIPDAVAKRIADGDEALTREVAERVAEQDPVFRQELSAIDADANVIIPPDAGILPAEHARVTSQAIKHVIDPDAEPMPVRVMADPQTPAVIPKLEKEIASLKAKIDEAKPDPEMTARIAELEAQVRRLDMVGRDPVADALLIRENPAFLTQDIDPTLPGVKTAIANAKLSDEAFAMVQNGQAPVELGEIVSDFVADPLQHATVLNDLVRMRPVSPVEARQRVSELLRSPEYNRTPEADAGPVATASKSPRLIDDPYGAEAKAQTQFLEQKFKEELSAEGMAPSLADQVLTPEGQVASVARAAEIDSIIEEFTGIAPSTVAIRGFDAISDLPPTLRAKVRQANAVRFGEQLNRFNAAKSEAERLAARAELDAASRGEGIEGIADGDTIWIASFAQNPRAKIAHEVVHSLKRTGQLRPEEEAILAAAAREAGVFSKDREGLYRDAYADRSNVDSVIEEEAAAHYIEAFVRGDIPASVPINKPAMSIVERLLEFADRVREALGLKGFRAPSSDTPVDPARDVVAAILNGEVAKREMASAQQNAMLFSMRNDTDSLGYYSGALRAARALRQEKGTPEQMLAMLKKEGAKDGEIEATGLGKLLASRESAASGSDLTVTGPLALYHGSPHDFDKLRTPAFLTADKALAENYRDGATTQGPSRNVYQVRLTADPGKFKTVSDWTSIREDRIYNPVEREKLKAELAADGYVGMRYRETPNGPDSYVVFDDSVIEITHKNGDRTSGKADSAGRLNNQITKSEIIEFLEKNKVALVGASYGSRMGSVKQAILTAAKRARDDGAADTAKDLEHLAAHASSGSDPDDLIANAASSGADVYLTNSEWSDLQKGIKGAAKWSSYSLDPSNPTYRETVLHLPAKMTGEPNIQVGEIRGVWWASVSTRHSTTGAGGSNKGGFATEAEARAWANETAAKQNKGIAEDTFKSGHFSEPNIIGHMMTSMTSHKGKSVYTIDQIQSDWGQKLRDGGVRDEAKIAELRKRVEEQYAIAEPLHDAHQATLPAGHSGRGWFEQAPEETKKAWRAYELLQAELRTAEASTPGNPLVNTTDQWTNTTLRRAIRQAAEADAEYIAIPKGETVLSYNPGDYDGMRKFYGGNANPYYYENLAHAKSVGDEERVRRIENAGGGPVEGIVPKNLRKLLTKIDRESPAPERIETLDSPSGKTGLGKGFTLFKLTDKVKQSVMTEGQPLFGMRQTHDVAHTATKDKGAGEYLSAKIGHPGYGYTASGEAMLVATDPARMMDWKGREQTLEVTRALNAVGFENGVTLAGKSGEKAYRALSEKLGSDELASAALLNAGIQGHKETARGFENSVVYDPSLVQRDPMTAGAAAPEGEPDITDQIAAIGERLQSVLDEYGIDASQVLPIAQKAMAGEDVTDDLMPLFAMRNDGSDDVSNLVGDKLRTHELPGYGTPEFDAGRRFNVDGAEATGYESGVSLLADKARAMAGPDGVEQGRKVTLLIGPPGAGKSTVGKAIAQQTRSAFLSADDAKAALPEYEGGANAQGVHVESTRLADMVMQSLARSGDNFILETLGRNYASMSKVAETLKSVGYDVRVVAVTAPRDALVSRIRSRAEQTGRNIDLSIMDETLSKLPDVIDKSTAATHLFSGVTTIDNGGDLPYILSGKETLDAGYEADLQSRVRDLGMVRGSGRPDVGQYGGALDKISEAIRQALDDQRIAGQDGNQVAPKGDGEGPLFAMSDNGRIKRGAERRAKVLGADIQQIEGDLKAAAIDQREALQRKRATFLNAQAEESGLDDLVKYRSPRGQEDLATAFLRMHESFGVHSTPYADVAGLRQEIARQAVGKMSEVMWELRKGALLGDLKRVKNTRVRTRMENMIREAAGEKTGDAVAQRMAKAWLGTAEWLRQSFNAAGGDIQKLDGWFAPQYHDAELLLKAGRKPWVDRMMQDGVLDRARMTKRDGTQMTDGEMREMLSDIWSTITTDGANKRDVTDAFGKGALYKRHAEHRVLHFKDADAFLNYAKEFGRSDPYSMMLGHIQMMARDIAALRRFGANPELVRERLKQHILLDAKASRSARSVFDDLSDTMSDLTAKLNAIQTPAEKAMAKMSEIHTKLDKMIGKPRMKAEREALRGELFKVHEELQQAMATKAETPEQKAFTTQISALLDEMDQISETQPVMDRNPEQRARRILTRADEMWKIFNGTTNVPTDGNLAGGMSAFRNWTSASVLAGASLSAIADQATGLAARAFIGMPVTKQFGSFLKGFTAEDRKFALRAQVGLDQAMNAFAVSTRFMGLANTAHLTGYITDRTHAFSGLAAMTQAAKIGFASDFMSWMAELSKKSYGSLPSWTKDMMNRHGFTEQDFAALKTVTPEMHRGIPVLTRPAIERDLGEDIAERYMRMLLREQSMAVLEPTLQGRTAFISETKPGSIIGEMARSVAMLKSFPTTYTMLILGRFQDAYLQGKLLDQNTLATAASIFVAGTVLGAIAMQMKSITAGQDPKPMDRVDFWQKAFMQSGGVGIFGDFIANSTNRFGSGIASTIMGPQAQTAGTILDATVGNVVQFGKDEKTNAGREAVNLARRLTPGAFVPFYLRSAYERMLLDQLQEMVDPEANKVWRRRRQNLKKMSGNDFYWPPGQPLPSRGPDLGSVVSK